MSTEEKPKIIVDDDWKTRVQAEKEQLRTGGGATPEGAGASAAPPTSAASESAPPSPTQLPPASFEGLVSVLVTQALAGLGQIPMGEKQQPVVRLDEAKHSIDLLGMLEEKTNGNLSVDEAEMLKNVLHELRMVFVAMKSWAK